MKDVRGADVVVIGILAWLLWKEYNPLSGGASCLPSGQSNGQTPLSTMYYPPWIQSQINQGTTP